jgi:hypothetical protein
MGLMTLNEPDAGNTLRAYADWNKIQERTNTELDDSVN